MKVSLSENCTVSKSLLDEISQQLISALYLKFVVEMPLTELPWVGQRVSHGKTFRDKSVRELIGAPGTFERICFCGDSDLRDKKPGLALLRVLM